MRLFPRWHSPEDVAIELIEGLRNGTLTLAPPALGVSEMIEELLRLTAEINAMLGRLDPGYRAMEFASAERLAQREQLMPGAVLKLLVDLQEIHAEAKALEANKKSLVRRKVVLFWSQVILTVAPLAYFTYLVWTRPVTAFAGYFLVFGAVLAVSALPRLLARARLAAEENARLLSAVADLVPQFKAAATIHPG